MSEINLCKFYKDCKCFREDSSTCTLYGGSPYCGKYREFSQGKKVNIEDLNQEIDELSLQRSEFQDPKTCKLIEKRISSLLDLKVMLQKLEEKDLKVSNRPEMEVS